MPSKNHVTRGNVLDELGFTEEQALVLKLKSEIHEGIVSLVKHRRYSARDLESILGIQQPRVSELMRAKLNTLSVARLLLYAKKLGGVASTSISDAA